RWGNASMSKTASARGAVVAAAMLAALAVPLAGSMSARAAPSSARVAGAIDGIWFWPLPNTPNGLRPTSTWGGAGSTPSGEIYIGGSDHTTNAALYRLGPGASPASAPGSTLTYVGDARAASEAANDWAPGDVAEKFHTRPSFYQDRIFVATLNHSDLDDGYL